VKLAKGEIMTPIGPYTDFAECVIKNSDKASPEGFCAWLEKQITGAWPGQMTSPLPESFLAKYDELLSTGKGEKEAYRIATEAALAEGWELSRLGWIKQFQAPVLKKITGVKVFAAGTWTDSAGNTREWTTQDEDKMIEAFKAGVPAVVPLKCGHTSDAFNQRIAEALGVPVENVTGDQGQGQIKLGDMSSLERKGSLLVSAFDKVPEGIANLIEGGQYTTVSVEIEDTVGEFGPVITAVALLGAEEPAVDKATLEEALVFAKREGARVLSFSVGDDIPIDVLRAEFNELRGKLADIVKGKRGAPIFRALFGNINNLFEQLIGGKHSAEENRIPVQGTKSNEGGNTEMLPKALEGLKADEIKAMSIKALGAKFQEDAETTVDTVVKAFQEGDLAAIAAALGLGEEATVEDIVTAIEAMKTAAAEAKADAKAPEGDSEMAKEFAKAGNRIAVLEGEKLVREWEARTREFTAIPGTAMEHAVKLAAIEGKAGKETAEDQFKALAEADRLAAEANGIIGTSRKGNPTDFDTELAKYKAENPTVEAAAAYEFVAKKFPTLWADKRK
jgi:hypothetical protein